MTGTFMSVHFSWFGVCVCVERSWSQIVLRCSHQVFRSMCVCKCVLVYMERMKEKKASSADAAMSNNSNSANVCTHWKTKSKLNNARVRDRKREKERERVDDQRTKKDKNGSLIWNSNELGFKRGNEPSCAMQPKKMFGEPSERVIPFLPKSKRAPRQKMLPSSSIYVLVHR